MLCRTASSQPSDPPWQAWGQQASPFHGGLHFRLKPKLLAHFGGEFRLRSISLPVSKVGVHRLWASVCKLRWWHMHVALHGDRAARALSVPTARY